MEILQIAPGRLKVTLSAQDLLEYRIDCDGLDYDSPASREAFEGILAVVKAKTDFETEGGRLYVQFYPSKDGGCELFLIHSRQVMACSDNAPVPYRASEGYLCPSEHLQGVLPLMELLKGRACAYRLYQTPEGGYLLYCKDPVPGAVLLLENYGKRVPPPVALYLEEHYRDVTI